MHLWTMKRNEQYFSPAPESFWPDRWLIAAGDMKYDGPADQPFVHNLQAFIPFSVGPANCVGKNLAMAEMRMVICLIMQKFELSFAEGWNPDEFDREMRDYVVITRKRLPVTIKLREKA